MEYHSFLLNVTHYPFIIRFLNSFRLLMEYHSFLSSLTVIHLTYLECYGFRLLMEYHSFLWVWNLTSDWVAIYSVSVSLWSIIHSYGKISIFIAISNAREFPSPYGVSFILIKGSSIKEWRFFTKFPSPYGVSFILIF